MFFSMITWCDQFYDYDPFLSPCNPSNPWVSDDPTLWALNADMLVIFYNIIKVIFLVLKYQQSVV